MSGLSMSVDVVVVNTISYWPFLLLSEMVDSHRSAVVGRYKKSCISKLTLLARSKTKMLSFVAVARRFFVAAAAATGATAATISSNSSSNRNNSNSSSNSSSNSNNSNKEQ